MKGEIRADATPASERLDKDRAMNQAVFHALVVSFAVCLLLSVMPVHGQPMGQAVLLTAHERYDGDADSVFNWTEVPADQEVTITRATFDEGGYQLYDSVGETIVVPFTNHNLYVMKFARSDNGTMYFVNSGTGPVLYVPEGGYLVNANDAGAKWYPFSPRFHPASPVYIGIAPNWNDYVDMGWYPDMAYYGGYWCDRPYYDDPGLFVAIPGLAIFIGGFDCGGWWPYYHYCDYHRPPFRTAFWDRDVYRWAGRPAFGRPAFGQRTFSQPFGRPAAWAHRTFSGRTVYGRPFREFRGAPGGVRNAGWSTAHSAHLRNAAMSAAHGGGNRNFNGNRSAGRSAGHFAGNRAASAQRHFGRAGNAGSRQWAHRSSGGRQSFARRSSGGGNRFGGGRQSFARRSFGGGGGPRFGGGGGQAWAHRSFGGGQHFMGGGGPHFGGGGGHPGGGGGRSGGGGGHPGGGGGDHRHDH